MRLDQISVMIREEKEDQKKQYNEQLLQISQNSSNLKEKRLSKISEELSHRSMHSSSSIKVEEYYSLKGSPRFSQVDLSSEF